VDPVFLELAASMEAWIEAWKTFSPRWAVLVGWRRMSSCFQCTPSPPPPPPRIKVE
jgi:hypothetical protein